MTGRAIAILRGRDDRYLIPAARVLLDAGLPLELPLTTPGALAAIEALGGRVGAGTVLTRDAAADAVSAGASFLVTPAMVPEVIAYGNDHGVPVYAGALTPTEVWDAHRAGAPFIKIFPASSVGPEYVAALRQPFPELRYVPVGGIGLDQAPAYLAAGAVAVGVGSPLVGDALTTGDLDGLRDRARLWAAL
ncbi:bifunctional 4-hydroxy-2-oxoglutarate aldolase/2-dehydro-3-deoxy-phosphogluconate aldolase [Actinomadura rupiterrae]|uniref:bifunctional 4-hydroxy-2-oxoglutarate aldolase/2-dehydro-3-deoxy-phosphogluconate aldolase n=1 Tax=Actinomadura rupiterrae TaxID=559627 RepID=UPI0020A34DBF|nr:bifunctional 4-hydroxy-2-oxoglutarate aldolase/2-dehydro-3-deoxy-phosphogluconate aldolase [Actinomadura rupiterrae]MCP2341134.1 2-dehydro-3-deoxyphosphogluconate aldolase/(4S)-4-hydroxy-2-oxoglutarate aldolase [Actinomadura rupiterrae]